MPRLENRKPYPDSNVKINSCLELIGNHNLEVALEICNKTIERLPGNPELLSERSLIYTLTGEAKLACLDAKNALKMIKEKNKKIDPLTKYQIDIRHSSCRK